MTNKRRFFRKTYLSHFIRNGTKRLQKVYVWEVSWRLNKDCNILTPSSSGYSGTSFSFSWVAQPGALRAQPLLRPGYLCRELQQLTPNSDLQLTRTSCSTRLYNCLTSTCFSERRICTQFNPSTVKVSPDIFDRMHLLFTQVHFFFDSLAGSEVNMLHSNLLRSLLRYGKHRMNKALSETRTYSWI